MSHAPEPWARYEGDDELPLGGSSVTGPVAIVDANGSPVIPDTPWCPSGIDLDRVVACVNFCRQFPTKFLECRQAVNLSTTFGPSDNPDRPNNLDNAAKSLADVPRFVGLIAVQRNE